jgi:hypothetical protein
MWGAAPLIALKAHCDIRLFEKYDHLLAVLPKKKIISPEIGQTSAARLK